MQLRIQNAHWSIIIEDLSLGDICLPSASVWQKGRRPSPSESILRQKASQPLMKQPSDMPALLPPDTTSGVQALTIIEIKMLGNRLYYLPILSLQSNLTVYNSRLCQVHLIFNTVFQASNFCDHSFLLPTLNKTICFLHVFFSTPT